MQGGFSQYKKGAVRAVQPGSRHYRPRTLLFGQRLLSVGRSIRVTFVVDISDFRDEHGRPHAAQLHTQNTLKLSTTIPSDVQQHNGLRDVTADGSACPPWTKALVQLEPLAGFEYMCYQPLPVGAPVVGVLQAAILGE